jgi:hypothetical protein
MGHYSRAMMPVSERVDRSTSRVPRRLAVTTTVVQLWLLSAYLLIDVLPYFWPHAVLAGWMDDPVGTWLLAIPALLLGFAAFWVAVFDTAVGAALAVTGVTVLLSARRRLSRRATAWLIAGTGLSVAFLVFSLSPLAEDIRIWVLD